MSSSSAITWRSRGTSRITFNQQDVVSSGSDGVQVFHGYFNGHIKVAVKRILLTPGEPIPDEINYLKNNVHEHIVRYYDHSRDESFCYIAMEICAGTLEDLVSGKYKGPSPGNSETVLYQITKALAYLHSKKIVHRDLKPLNILIAKPDGSLPPKMKLADFGVSKKQTREYYFSNTGTTGTIGWAAPELLDDKREKFDLSIDIFSLGCIFGYVLTGHHPFGSTLYRTGNILNNKLSWDGKNKIKNKSLKELIKRMIANNYKNRPNIEEVLKHPSISQPPLIPVVSINLSVAKQSAESAASKTTEEEAQPKKATQNTFSSLFSRGKIPPSTEKTSKKSVSKESINFAGQTSLSIPSATSNLKVSPNFSQRLVKTPPKQSSIPMFSAPLGGLQNSSTEKTVPKGISKDSGSFVGNHTSLPQTVAVNAHFSGIASTSPQRSPASAASQTASPFASPAGRSRSSTNLTQKNPPKATNGAKLTPPLPRSVRSGSNFVSDGNFVRQNLQYSSLTTRRGGPNSSPLVMSTSTHLSLSETNRDARTSFERQGSMNLSQRDLNDVARRRFFS